jgi:predicted RNA-binding Zn-ribbon protein involved in translation (DUF1610 family)
MDHNLPDSPDASAESTAPDARPEPQVHLFCPSCGELTTIGARCPLALDPSKEEISYTCAHCGTETKVQIAKHARFSVHVNEVRYFGDDQPDQ